MDEASAQVPSERPKLRLFDGAHRNKKYVLKSSAVIILFWLAQLAYQLSLGRTVGISLVVGSAFAGVTLISAALIVGPLARLTRYNFIFHRRTMGVWGFSFVIVHMVSVIAYLLNFDASLIFWRLDPFANPILLGFISFWLFVPAYLTSTDWALSRLGFKRWKSIHRLVYFAYIFSVLHYLKTNPASLDSPPGYLLIALTAAALVLQVLGFAKTILKSRSSKDLATGIIIILFALFMAYLALNQA